jgi:hypothetical protein
VTDSKILSDYIVKFKGRREYFIADRIECRDGFSVSVQAHPGAYCRPRDGMYPWDAFECGYPSAPVPEWSVRKEGGGDDKKSVFGYIDARDIMNVIRSHGGAECLEMKS